jgi:hypothetical protein
MLWPSSATGPLSQWAKCARKQDMTDEGQERHLRAVQQSARPRCSGRRLPVRGDDGARFGFQLLGRLPFVSPPDHASPEVRILRCLTAS